MMMALFPLTLSQVNVLIRARGELAGVPGSVLQPSF
jgi:hypothetical protein